MTDSPVCKKTTLKTLMQFYTAVSYEKSTVGLVDLLQNAVGLVVTTCCYSSWNLLLCPAHIMAKHAGEICSSLPLRAAVLAYSMWSCWLLEHTEHSGQRLESPYGAQHTQTEASQRCQPNANPQRLSNTGVGLLAVIGVCVLCVFYLYGQPNVSRSTSASAEALHWFPAFSRSLSICSFAFGSHQPNFLPWWSFALKNQQLCDLTETLVSAGGNGQCF